jgi:hypothetical protein
MLHVEPDPPRRLHAVGVAALPLIVLLVVAWLLYRPELARSFDYVDFPENILILKSHGGFSERFRAISSVYAEHGRFSPITLAAIAAQWTWFEWWTPGWQLFRFVVMSGVVVLAYALFLRLGLAAIGAFTAASLLIASPGAVVGWTRLSTAEPLGIVWLLIACHLALRRPRFATASLFAVTVLGVLWTKEVMTAAFLFPLLLAIQAPAIALELSSPKKTLAWFVPAGVALMLGCIPIIHTWATAPVHSFAGRYGSSQLKFSDIAGAWMAALLPFAPIPTESIISLLIAVFAFLFLVVVGWRVTLAQNSSRRHGLLLMTAITVPLAGALVYAPWPFYLMVYALPFTVAGALLSGQAVSSLFRADATGRITGGIGLAILLTYCLAQAANESRRTYALQQSFAASVRRVSELAGVDTVFVGVESGQFDSQGNFGLRFRLYAAMLGLEWPAVRDVLCQQLPSTPPPRVLVLRVNLMCEPAAQSQRRVISNYPRFVWPNPVPRRDSVLVTFSSPLPDSLP